MDRRQRRDDLAAMADLRAFPSDWQSAVVLVPHPDDPEYGCSAAVAKWTAAGRSVCYVFCCRGEAGIEGMSREETGRVREAEQRKAAAIVGVDDVVFWDFPDSNIRNTAELRAAIADELTTGKPDVALTIFGGAEWAPGAPNQRDHIEFAAAVVDAYDGLPDPPRWLFVNGRGGNYLETVDGFVDVAVDSLAAHEKYLSVLDPETPVIEQARKQVEWATDFDGTRGVGFILERGV
jgi:LmbE family N-acetylglucosaminyl deacetylase